MTTVSHRCVADAGFPPYLAIGLLSASALAYEVLLTRLFSMIHWPGLVGMIISLALLGYGASGTFLSLLGDTLTRHFRLFFALNALLFGLLAWYAFQFAARVPLNPLDLAWNWRQLAYLLQVYLLLALPFFVVANALGLALRRYRSWVNRIYGSDLLGAGIGSAAVLLLLFLSAPSQALFIVAACGTTAGIVGVVESMGWRHRPLWWLLLPCLLALISWLAKLELAVEPADYKDLSQSLTARGAAVLVQESHPLGVVTLLENRQVPMRHAPGLSLLSPFAPPGRAALFVDGDFSGALAAPDQQSDYLGYLSSALAYQLVAPARVLLVGAGDATGVEQALALGAEQIDLIEPHPRLLALQQAQLEHNRAFAGRVSFYPRTLRSHLRQPHTRYDLIQLTVGEGLGDAGGLNSSQEEYRYTLESLRGCLERLTPNGVVTLTRGLNLPPKDGLKLVAAFNLALRQLGKSEPAQHLALIRGWNTLTLVVALEPLSGAQRQAVRRFSRERMFDLVYLSDLGPEEVNRLHRLARPFFHEGVRALLGEGGERFIDDYRFDIRVTTDDRPYFNHFLRLSRVGELLQQPAGSGLAHLDWGYALLLIALLLALLSSLLLILLPLALLRRRLPAEPGWGRVVLFFSAIGIAFLFIEIAFIQRLQLFLGHPVYAVTAVLAGFLASAGLGSFASHWLAQRFGAHVVLAAVVVTIALWVAQFLWLGPALLEGLGGLPLLARFVFSFLLILPLGLAMGMPFALGLQALGERQPALMPWAWGINGCASVVSALLAALLAVDLGFSGLMLLSAALYLLAWAGFPGAD